MALLLVLVPAILMVSRIRFLSITTIIPEGRRSSLSLIVIAGVIAAIAAQPQVVLLLMAYAYLVSGPIGFVINQLKQWRSSRRMADRDDGLDRNKRSA